MVTQKKKQTGRPRAKKPAKKKPAPKKPEVKKAPPKKKKRAPTAKATPPKGFITEGALPNAADSNVSNLELRRCAGQDYVFSKQHLSIARLSEMPFYAGRVTLRTLELWASEDRWAEKRKAWAEEVRKEAENSIGTQFIQERIAEIQRLQEMRDVMDASIFKERKGQKVFKKAPKTTEGMVAQRLKLGKQLDELIAAVGNQIPQHVSTSVVEPESKSPLHHSLQPQLSEDEIYLMARTVLRKRMDEQRSKLEPDEEEDSPTLKIVDGEKE